MSHSATRRFIKKQQTIFTHTMESLTTWEEEQCDALREANELRLRLAETETYRSTVEEQRDALQAELEALRERTAAEIAELRRVHDVERTHLHHGQEQLGGRLVRRLDDAVETLEVGLSALRNKTPRVEVMLERAELVVDALKAEIKNLREVRRELV